MTFWARRAAAAVLLVRADAAGLAADQVLAAADRSEAAVLAITAEDLAAQLRATEAAAQAEVPILADRSVEAEAVLVLAAAEAGAVPAVLAVRQGQTAVVDSSAKAT